MTSPGLTFDDVAFRYRSQKEHDEPNVLEHVTHHASSGEFTAIVGPSGCGKTTLLRIAAGFESADCGDVRLRGASIRGPGPERAVVFQSFALMPWKTVEDNIEFGLKCRGVPRSERPEIVSRYIGLMGLNGYEKALPGQISGGMRQRVAIARSYALDPIALLMDEPFGALDAQTRADMQTQLRTLRDQDHRDVLFITHDVTEAAYLADKVLVMSRRPATIVDLIDVATIRSQRGWADHDVVDVSSDSAFLDIRSRIWHGLRGQHSDD